MYNTDNTIIKASIMKLWPVMYREKTGNVFWDLSVRLEGTLSFNRVLKSYFAGDECGLSVLSR